MANTLKNLKVQLQQGTSNTLIATWSWNGKYTDHYSVKWTYTSGDKYKSGKNKGKNIWLIGNESSESHKQSTYSIPDTAISVKFAVKPMAKMHEVKDKKGKKHKEHYWNSKWYTSATYKVGPLHPDIPPVPTVKLNDDSTSITLSVNVNVSSSSTSPEKIMFQVKNHTDNTVFNVEDSSITATGLASVKYDLAKGCRYEARCYAIDKKGRSSSWSEWTDVIEAKPNYPEWRRSAEYEKILKSKDKAKDAASAMGFIRALEALSNSGKTLIDPFEVLSYDEKLLKIWWIPPVAPKQHSDYSYEIEYAKDPSYFDSGYGVGSVTVSGYDNNYVIVSGDEFFGGQKPVTFFRIRSKSGSLVSDWNPDIVKIQLGLQPNPPTTYTLQSTYQIGDKITFYWVHNSVDGSLETKAWLNLTINGVTSTIIVYKDEIVLNSYTGDGVSRDYIIGPPAPNNNSDITVEIDDRIVYSGWSIINQEFGRGKLIRFDNSHIPASGASIKILCKKTNPNVSSIEQDNISSYELDTSYLTGEDTEILWTVMTAGAGIRSNESIQRSVKVWTPPTISAITFVDPDNSLWLWDTFNFNLDSIITAERDLNGADDTDIISEYPFYIRAIASPTTQDVIKWFLSLTANESYETYDFYGNLITVNEGDTVYSVTFNGEKKNQENSLYHILTPENVSLENGESYTLHIKAVMNSGLSANYEKELIVQLDDSPFDVDADIFIDPINISAKITPYAYIDHNVEDPDDPLNTHWDPDLVERITDVYLSVYRRSHDGELILIDGALDGRLNTTVFDLHPPLTFAVYRVVAVNRRTGKMAFDDVASDIIGESGIIIQWDEESVSYYVDEVEDLSNDDVSDDDLTPSSMLRLPYNVKVSDSRSPDVALVEYIGRKHPVSYYGTQKGETSTWSTEIDKEDEETLFAIRRLASYSGNVYVREGSGTGYWAHLTVSYNFDYDSLIVPVTFNITRVEGGA